MKRGRDEGESESPQTTPKKTRTNAIIENGTPSRRNTPSRLRKEYVPDDEPIDKENGVTPKSARKVLFATPQKAPAEEEQATPKGNRGTPSLVRNADRSARRKSARRLIERDLDGEQSDDDVIDEEDALAAQILGEDDGEEEEEHEDGDEEVAEPETPSKKRGRRKGTTKKTRNRSPTPPFNLPSHELYFWQNRPGANKTSSNTLGGQALLNHEEYFHVMETMEENHEAERDFLLELHARAFDQWVFELEEGFNLALYGYGSKRSLLEYFAEHLYAHLSELPSYTTKSPPKILMINGSNPSLTLRDVLSSIATTFLPSSATGKLPIQPPALLSHIISTLSSLSAPKKDFYILLSSLDSPVLRRAPSPTLLGTLISSIPQIHLVATFDTPTFPLLYDTALAAQYHFLFHDSTTFAPYTTELSVVDDVNTLLGRSGRRMAGKDGVEWVLRSLPANARSLYLILVSEQLASMLESGQDDIAPSDPTRSPSATPSKKKAAPNVGVVQGVPYRTLYQRAVQSFVTNGEASFRTQLKEFYDHDMVESRRDAAGMEYLVVPFGREECEELVEMLAAEEG